MSKIKDKKIKKISKTIVKHYSPKKIILFGSYAWGEPTRDSDFDFFIVKETGEPRRKRQLRLREALFELGFPIDVLVYTPKEIKNRLNMGDFFIKDIIKKGKVLYEEKSK